MECVVLEFPEPESALDQLGKVTHSGINLKACLHDARFLAQSLWTQPPTTFGTSCSILRARSCMQDCAYTLQDVRVIKCLVI